MDDGEYGQRSTHRSTSRRGWSSTGGILHPSSPRPANDPENRARLPPSLASLTGFVRTTFPPLTFHNPPVEPCRIGVKQLRDNEKRRDKISCTLRPPPFFFPWFGNSSSAGPQIAIGCTTKIQNFPLSSDPVRLGSIPKGEGIKRSFEDDCGPVGIQPYASAECPPPQIQPIASLLNQEGFL